MSVYSCKTEVTQRSDYKEVMRVHDEAMARMGEMIELKNQIKDLESTQLEPVDSEIADKLVAELEAADEGMMVWMSEFRIPEDGNSEDLKSFFINEQKKVNIVNTDISTAIINATTFLKNH